MATKSKSLDIKVKETFYRLRDKFVYSKLDLEMSGNDMNYVIANSLRRASYDDIPTYAFEVVEFEHNNMKAFDCDYMRCRLRQLPIYNIENNLYYLHPKYWHNVNYYDNTREKHPSEKLVEAVINVHNNTTDIMPVTTKDMQYYIDGVRTPYEDPNPEHPMLLAELKPENTLKCKLRGVLGVGEKDTIWFGSKLMYYNYEIGNPNLVHLTVEGNGQVQEYVLLVKCCRLLKLKLKGVKNEIKQRVDTGEIQQAKTIFFELVNEDHTMGELINYALQNHQGILFSGVSKPDHLVKLIKFKIMCDDTYKTPVLPLFEVIDYLINVFDELESQFIKLGKVKLPEQFADAESETNNGKKK